MGVQVQSNGETTNLAARVDAQQTEATDKRKVKLLATAANPIPIAPGQTPRIEDLVATAPDGAEISQIQGTPTAPNLRNDMLPDSLFIGGQPAAADVRQGGLGDCYFMAVLLGIVNGDPAKLIQMMALAGGNVSTTFHRLDNAAGEWVEQVISTNAEIQTRNRTDGSVGTNVKGARFRVANDAQRSEWWAHIDGNTLKVFQKNLYEVALWGPLIEKTYAFFAQQFGRYGNGMNGDEGKGGYDIIGSGGMSQACYRMFYGEDVADESTQAVNFDGRTDSVQLNADAIQRLLTFELNKQAQDGQTQQYAQARISPDGAIRRAKLLAEAVLRHQTKTEPGAFRRFINKLRGKTPDANVTAARANIATALGTFIAAIDTYLADRTQANKTALVTQAQAIEAIGAHDLLRDPDAAKVYHDLLENLGVVINLGTDNGPGRRMVYAAHAYNIMSVALCNAQGAALTMQPAEVPRRLAEIDGVRSSVVLENPHARNEPNMNGPIDAVNEGRFTLTLDSFLRNTDLLRLAAVDH